MTDAACLTLLMDLNDAVSLQNLMDWNDAVTLQTLMEMRHTSGKSTSRLLRLRENIDLGRAWRLPKILLILCDSILRFLMVRVGFRFEFQGEPKILSIFDQYRSNDGILLVSSSDGASLAAAICWLRRSGR